MRHFGMGAALGMLLLTSCSPRAARPVVATVDPAELAKCPQVYAQLGTLPKLERYRLGAPATVTAEDGGVVTLPAGAELVPLGVVLAREGVTFAYAMAGRDMWQRCASSVRYVIEWNAAIAKGN